MSEAKAVRPHRDVAIADHLWSTFEEMAEAMGADRDGLINQAMFMFARLNGFLEAGGAQGARPSPPVLHPVNGGTPHRGRTSHPTEAGEADPERKQVAARVLETAAELERLIKGRPGEEAEASFDDADDFGAEPDAGLPAEEDDGYYDEPADDAAPLDDGYDDVPEGEGLLYLVTESGDTEAIAKDRFVIGRGKHCDFVINSGKVSREHAVITQEADGFYIEDLGSSNGTWFNKQRIKRRKIEDGDEYFICSEKVQLVLR